jgi:hypothetical protein
MVSAAYRVRDGECALGPLEGRDVELPELYVLELHVGAKPALRPVRGQEIGICLDHWREVVQGITEAVIALVAQEDPAIAGELQERLEAQRAE